MTDKIFSQMFKDNKKGKEKVEETIKPNIINKYVNEALKSIDEEITVKRENPLQKNAVREKAVPPTENKSEELISRLIEKQLNLTKGSVERKINKENPLQKKIEKSVQEEGLPDVEYEEHPNPRFMKGLSRHEIKNKNHSSIIIAKRCLREYFYNVVLNRVSKNEPVIFLPWGSAYHLFRQRLSEYYGYGENEPNKYDSTKAKEAFKKASREGIEYWHKYGEDQKPDSKYDWYTAERLYLSFLKAFEFWSLERKQGRIKIVAVEQFFTVQLIDGSFRQGRVDEALIIQDELWGRDFKTTQKPRDWFMSTMRINNQVKTYSFGNGKLAGRHCKGLLVEAMYNAKATKQGPKGPDVFNIIVETTPDELNQWEKEQVHWNNILDICREDDIWPQSEVACQYCDYNQVCSKPTEAAMLYTLENKYTKFLRNPAIVEY